LFGLFNIAHGKGDFWAGIIDSFFRGRIRILHESGMMSLVNIVGLEEYLYGVLPSEMYPDFPKEALKAQAVIARTLALKRKGQFKKKGYDFLNSTSTQVYLGVSQEKPASTAAVDATRGIVLSLPDGGIPEMFFASNSGGYTVDKGFGLSYYRGARDVKIMSSLTFPLDSRELVGYLSPAFDCFSRPKDADKFSAYRWQRFYTQNEAKMLVNAAGFKCDAVFGIDVVRRNVSGHAEEVSVDTDRGEYVIEGEGRIRDALGKLRSSLFFAQKMQTGDDLPDFMIWGGGFGHGIGLCQFGARGMAEAGRTWKEVLAHYYPALELKKAY
jgi:peptidoglycan hydrolase-like amidase